jgi:hypothetical protein
MEILAMKIFKIRFVSWVTILDVSIDVLRKDRSELVLINLRQHWLHEIASQLQMVIEGISNRSTTISYRKLS